MFFGGRDGDSIALCLGDRVQLSTCPGGGIAASGFYPIDSKDQALNKNKDHD